MRVLLTAYSITFPDSGPKPSYVLEGSLDGEQWSKLDRRIDCNREERLLFALWRPMECRFIRLRPTDSPRPRRPLVDWESDRRDRSFLGETRDDVRLRFLRAVEDVNRFNAVPYFCASLKIEFFGKLSE
jgi:hypothetical protein